MTSLIINLLLAVFNLQPPSCEAINKSQGDLNSSNSNYFPYCAIIFRVSTSIFCVLIWPSQSFHTVCYRIGTRDTLKKMICPSLSQGLFLLLCNFHMNLNMQTHDLTDYQLTVGSF